MAPESVLVGQSPAQPSRTDPFVPREWVHRYHRIRMIRNRDGAVLEVPCTAANFFLMDLNPQWYVDGLVRHGGDALFILYLDTTNACTDECNMCFTAATRRAEGLDRKLDIDLTLRRIAQLREQYPDTFRMVSMAGPGEPLSLPGIERLLEETVALGCATRVYTAGHRLRLARTRKALLRSTSLVRVSVDAASEESYRLTHGVSGLAARFEGIRALVEERGSASSPLIGTHFVIQRENMHEITRFAEICREIGVDYVVYGQETFGTTAGGFTPDDYRSVVSQLREVELMHADDFAVVVPRLVHRQTIVEFDKTHFAPPAELNRCHNSKHRIFFGVQNDFSACWLATLDSQFRRESYVGQLASDETFDSVNRIIQHGVGSVLTDGAKLSCNSCVAGNYNGMVDTILGHLGGETDFTVELVPHEPGNEVYDEGYEFVLVGDEKATLTPQNLSARPGQPLPLSVITH
jgi:MoaA/NifB/PqqE/SkfB family radical SAM enzyme